MKYNYRVLMIILLFYYSTELKAGNYQIDSELHKCLKKTEIQFSTNNSIEVMNNSIRKLQPHFFGFNLNWVGFQHSYWSSKTKSVNESVLSYLKKSFSGAIYRYPGGSVSNRFDWEKSIGTLKNRLQQKAVDWKPPIVAEFGYSEFIDFVNSVNGKPWIVSNLHGSYYKEFSIEILAEKAKNWAEYTQNIQPSIVRWELGNELDRNNYKWSAEKYSMRANKISNAIKSVDHKAKFVSILRDFDVKDHGTANEYNSSLSYFLKDLNPEYALHHYYDSPSGWGMIPKRLKQLCTSINQVKKSTSSDPTIWITEHARARTTRTNSKSWKKDYPKTSDLQSAISVSDYIISLTQIPEVEGAFIHTLGLSDGPWTMFHLHNTGIKESLVYSALKMLRESMLEDVLLTFTKSQNHSKYRGGYDLRASVQTNPERTKYVIWIVNRASESKKITLKIPKLSSKLTNAIMRSLFDNDLSNNNIQTQELLPTKEGLKLLFNSKGEVKLNIPHQSLTTVMID